MFRMVESQYKEFKDGRTRVMLVIIGTMLGIREMSLLRGTIRIKTVGDYAGENVVKVINYFTPAGSDTKNDVGPSYDTDALSEVPNYNTHNDDMFNPFAPERQHSEQPIRINDAYVEETNDSNIGYSIYKH
ncbi:hypothetical protein Tco_1295799 [Tanacetum coccineum]